MSDGPSKVIPEPEPLDEIILGEDETIADPGPPAPIRASSPPLPRPSRPPDRPSAPPLGPPPPREKRSSSSRLRAAANVGEPEGSFESGTLRAYTPDGKKRKMTLRIPDDEVARPQYRPPSENMYARPLTGPPPPRAMDFSADDTLELPPDENRMRAHAIALADAERFKTDPPAPYTPEVDPDEATLVQDMPRIEGSPIVELRDMPAPISEEIPVEMDLDVPDTASDEIATNPRLPEVADDDVPVELADRPGETGEVEIAPEDLMSVESLPSPAQVARPTATALMAGVAPAPSPSKPHVAAAPVHAEPLPISAAAVTAPEGGRRPTPLVFVPPVGALAPPPMTDTAAAHRKKTRPWWEELFNDDFIRTMAKVTDAQIGGEVNFIEESLGCEAGAMILDLACGTGRHAVELAARGYQVVGFDLSLAMLARASDEAQDRKQKINFVQGDMREMTFEETFDGIYSWNTSFGYFDEEKNGAVIARVHKALKKGGQFLLDVVNRDYIVRQAPSLAWFEGDGCICMDEMTIDFITSRMRVKRTLMMDDGRTKEIEYSVRIYALHELGKMLHDNGFRVAEVSGRTGTPGVFFGCESPRTLILAEKR
jgi:SAM-dependent methyltransferase